MWLDEGTVFILYEKVDANFSGAIERFTRKNLDIYNPFWFTSSHDWHPCCC